MAKGRKSATSHPERFIGNSNYGQGATTVAVGEDLREEEVWSMMIDHASLLNDGNTADKSSRGARWLAMTSHQQHHHASSSSNSSRHQVVGGLSMALEGGNRTAAMRVPEWRGVEEEEEEEEEGGGGGSGVEEEEERVAPHEYLARERAQRGRLVGTSVVEGKGRTLKGRDVSRVRDAVWSRTGFSG